MREILMMNNQMFTPSIRVMLSTLNNPLTKFDNKTLLHNIGRNKFMEMRYYEKYGGGKVWQKIKRFGKRVYNRVIKPVAKVVKKIIDVAATPPKIPTFQRSLLV